MQEAELHIFGFDNPALAVLSVAALVGIGLSVVAAVLRLRGDRAWDRAFRAGGALLAVALVGGLLYSWIAGPVPQ